MRLEYCRTAENQPFHVRLDFLLVAVERISYCIAIILFIYAVRAAFENILRSFPPSIWQHTKETHVSCSWVCPPPELSSRQSCCAQVS